MKFILIFIFVLSVALEIAYSEQLLFDTSDNTEADNLNKMAWSKFLQSNFVESVLLFDKVLEIESNNTYALLHQGYAYTELGEFTKARENYKKIFEKFPIHLTGFNAIGDTYILENNLQEAQVWYEKTLRDNPFDTYALLKMADIQLEKGNYEIAVKEYDKVLFLKPSEQDIITNTRLGKGISYFHLDIHSLAQSEFSYVIEQGNTAQKIIAHIYQGLSLKQTDNLSAAQKEFDQAESFNTKTITLQTELNKVNKAKNKIHNQFDFWNYTTIFEYDSISSKFTGILFFLILAGVVIYTIYRFFIKKSR